MDAPERTPAGPAPREHRGMLILVMGITAVLLSCCGLPFGILPWLLAARDLRAMDAGEMDPAGRQLTQAGYACAIVGTIVAVLNVAAYFAMKPLMERLTGLPSF